MEHEDGTFEFLQAIPVSAQQILVSKCLTTALLTIAIYFVLGPLTYQLTKYDLVSLQTTNATNLTDIVGLWGMAVLEAIAWGTLFSLVTARPLVAICLAMLAGSSIVHILSWKYSHTAYGFDLAAYTKALPWRGLVAACVFAADIALGLRWLDLGSLLDKRKSAKSKRGKTITATNTLADEELPITQLAVRPDRGAMFSHLLWQHWRQSRWLLLAMAGILIAFPLMLLASYFQSRQQYAVVAIGVISALMGACVFLPDQEQRRFRFFMEHNVPALRLAQPDFALVADVDDRFVDAAVLVDNRRSHQLSSPRLLLVSKRRPPDDLHRPDLHTHPLRRRPMGIDVHSQRPDGRLLRLTVGQRCVRLDIADGRHARRELVVLCRADSNRITCRYVAARTGLDSRKQIVACPRQGCGHFADSRRYALRRLADLSRLPNSKRLSRAPGLCASPPESVSNTGHST